MLTIRVYPDPILRRKADKIEDPDQIRDLVEKMFDAMYQNDGIGLAAPQVGLSRALITVDTEEGPVALINPEIIQTSDETGSLEEGCLSLPDIRVSVERPRQVTVRALNLRGEEVEIRAEGLLAVVLQPEIDHLNGILIIDRASSVSRNLFKKQLKKLEKMFQVGS
jgi:peptide deformylase